MALHIPEICLAVEDVVTVSPDMNKVSSSFMNRHYSVVDVPPQKTAKTEEFFDKYGEQFKYVNCKLVIDIPSGEGNNS